MKYLCYVTPPCRVLQLYLCYRVFSTRYNLAFDVPYDKLSICMA
jgi:hypothetical protein